LEAGPIRRFCCQEFLFERSEGNVLMFVEDFDERGDFGKRAIEGGNDRDSYHALDERRPTYSAQATLAPITTVSSSLEAINFSSTAADVDAAECDTHW
jgi:hypothetical protein